MHKSSTLQTRHENLIEHEADRYPEVHKFASSRALQPPPPSSIKNRAIGRKRRDLSSPSRFARHLQLEAAL
jgi:hypothetical protein